jgi:hypothetical protein
MEPQIAGPTDPPPVTSDVFAELLEKFLEVERLHYGNKTDTPKHRNHWRTYWNRALAYEEKAYYPDGSKMPDDDGDHSDEYLDRKL